MSTLFSIVLKLRNTTCSCKIQRNGGCWFTCNESYAFGPSLFKGNDISDKLWGTKIHEHSGEIEIHEILIMIKSGIFGLNAGKM